MVRKLILGVTLPSNFPRERKKNIYIVCIPGHSPIDTPPNHKFQSKSCLETL